MLAAIKSKLNYNDAAGGPGCKSSRGLGVSAPVGHKAPCLSFLFFFAARRFFVLSLEPAIAAKNFSTGDLSELGLDLSKGACSNQKQTQL